MYRLLSCLRKNFYRYIGISVILSPIAGFLSLVRVTQFSQFVVVVVVLLFYVHGKHLRSCRDGQLT